MTDQARAADYAVVWLPLRPDLRLRFDAAAAAAAFARFDQCLTIRKCLRLRFHDAAAFA